MPYIFRGTVTWDVFKSNYESGYSEPSIGGTVTWDVFKSVSEVQYRILTGVEP